MEEKENMDLLFRGLVENSDDIIVVADHTYKIRFVSSSVSKIFKKDSMALLGKDVFDFVNKEKAPSWKNILKSRTNKFSSEICLELEGIKNYFDVFVTRYTTDLSEGYLLKLHNVTERKENEKALKQSNAQLDQVIYKTTHDLKAPLMSALGLINIAEVVPDAEKGLYLTMIRKSLKKLESYIDEMNHFFRNDKLAVQREKIEMRSLLEDELDNFKNGHNSERIDIRTQVDENCEFYSDKVRIKTIVTNILSNAIKYSDPHKECSFIQIDVLVNAEVCSIKIEDNGIGIQKEDQAKIFDMFYRATDQIEGTGLGLFIVKDTVERLNGTIKLYSEFGRGTTFLLHIPNQARVNTMAAVL
ncbi:MAG: PAS domain-containing sensor histidine kinase [Flammeovirgaceae bacterium]|nr:PAS domain-containing sensor histidine kinase [Flammeovirgaceae bacterium]